MYVPYSIIYIHIDNPNSGGRMNGRRTCYRDAKKIMIEITMRSWTGHDGMETCRSAAVEMVNEAEDVPRTNSTN